MRRDRSAGSGAEAEVERLKIIPGEWSVLLGRQPDDHLPDVAVLVNHLGDRPTAASQVAAMEAAARGHPGVATPIARIARAQLVDELIQERCGSVRELALA